jgi:starch phosphorylase
MVASGEYYKVRGAKSVAYLSAEFLMGPHLANNILNLKLGDPVREAITSLGLDLDTILDAEEEPGLGNGGLGRLAACYMDSLATLEIPASATASATSTASSTKTFGTGGRLRSPTSG